MTSPNPDALEPDVPPARPPYRPPIGIPVEREVTVRGFAASLGLHALLLLLVLLPALLQSFVPREVESAGGPGPAGGGGGGRGGTGGDLVNERLHYVQVAPAPPATAAKVPTPPVVRPPVVPLPKPTPSPNPATPPPTPNPSTAEAAPPTEAAAPVQGTGGGTGNDGTAGSGPGTGGGVGSGVGTGQGAGAGPGTGGGNGNVYTPLPITAFFPPTPIPRGARGKEIVAEFDVDSTGRVISVNFTPTSDGGYNRRLRELFGEMKWRPAVKPDGTPVRAKATFAYTL